MATFTSAQAAAGYPVHQPPAGIVARAYGYIAISANPTDGDIYEMLKLPAGAVVIGGWIQANDIDTNATETLDLMVGVTGNTDKYLAATVLTGDAVTGVNPEVGVKMNLMGLLTEPLDDTDVGGPQTESSEVTIKVECNTTAATFDADSHLTLVVDYVMPVTTNA